MAADDNALMNHESKIDYVTYCQMSWIPVIAAIFSGILIRVMTANRHWCMGLDGALSNGKYCIKWAYNFWQSI